MGKRRRFFPLYVLLSLLIGLSGCHHERTLDRSQASLSVKLLGTAPFVSPQYAHAIHWPQFLLAEAQGRFLWAAGSELHQVEPSEFDADAAAPADAELTKGLDRLISAARSSQGDLAVLDSSGTIAIRRPSTGKVSRFSTHLENSAGRLTLTGDRAYVQLQGDSENGYAVAAYTFAGAEAGRWGKIPADGILQSNLDGGGLAACPDGSVFYSYINSPQILRIEKSGEVSAMGRRSDSFVQINDSQVREASRASRLAGNVAQLVKLGLRASRIQALFCSEDGLLFRQVAQPHGGGAHIEVWDPASELLVGAFPVQDGTLLAVRDHILYLGVVSSGFELARIKYRVDRPRIAKAGA